MASAEPPAHTHTRHRVIRLAAFGTAAAAVLYLLVYMSTASVSAPLAEGGVRGMAPSVSHSSAAAAATMGGANRVDRGRGGSGSGSNDSVDTKGSASTGHGTGGDNTSTSSSSGTTSSSTTTTTSQGTSPVELPAGSGLGVDDGHEGAAASDSGGATATSEAPTAAAAGGAAATAGSSISGVSAAATARPPLCTSNAGGGKWLCESQVVTGGGATATAPTSECFLYGDNPVWRPSHCRLAPPLQRRSRAHEACEVLGRFASVTFVGDSVVLGMFKAMAGLANTRGHKTQCWNHKAVVDVDATSLFPCHRGTGIVSAPQCHTPPSDLSCCTKDKPLESRCLQDLFFVGRGCEKHFGTYDTYGDQRVCDGELKMAGFLVYIWSGSEQKRHTTTYLQHTLQRPGDHVIVFGSALHYLPKKQSRKPKPSHTVPARAKRVTDFYDSLMRLLPCHGASPCRYSPKGGAATVTTVVVPMHPRDFTHAPLLKFKPTQSNEAVETLNNLVAGHIHEKAGFRNGWGGGVGLRAGAGTLPADTVAYEPGYTYMLDTWRVVAAAEAQCPSQAPSPPDGTHLSMPGDYVKSRLLLNLLGGIGGVYE